MDQKTFTQELAKLTAIPVTQAAQAKAVARFLTDGDREAFLKKLTSIHGELLTAAKEELKALESFELALMGLEKRLNRSVRSSAEAKERRSESRKAEKKLQDFS